jgi:hypothetical protein
MLYIVLKIVFGVVLEVVPFLVGLLVSPILNLLGSRLVDPNIKLHALFVSSGLSIV